MVPEVPSQRDDENALAGRAPERAAPSPRGAQPGDAPASPASGPTSETGRHREEGKEGSRETLGPDGFPVQTRAAQQLPSPNTVSVGDDTDISFDPSYFDGQGESSNTPCPITTTGSEDWLTVNFHVDFPQFEKLAEKLNAAQVGATKDKAGEDEIEFGSTRYIVAARGAKQGGKKSIYMRWHLTAGNGLVVLLMNRGKSHRTMPNATVRAPSLLLMQLGFDRTWNLMQDSIRSMGGEIAANKLSRVDACVDLPGTDISEFAECFINKWVVSRPPKRMRIGVPNFVQEYLSGTRYESFYFGQTPLLCRIYDKLAESRRDVVKRAVLEATRWGGLPECATRVELQLGRTPLSRFGIDSVEDWVAKRADVIDLLTSRWLRLTAGPYERNHANRTPMHPVWEKTRSAFFAWCGESIGQKLTPLPKLEINSSRQVATVIGILRGMFARTGKHIADNEKFLREMEWAVRDGIGERDMAAEVTRKALELGMNVFEDDF